MLEKYLVMKTLKKLIQRTKGEKKYKVSSEPIFQIMEYASSNIIVTKGKSVEIEKSIVEHYNYLNFQDKKERENKEDSLRSLQLPQLTSALDKRNQSRNIAVIQPS